MTGRKGGQSSRGGGMKGGDRRLTEAGPRGGQTLICGLATGTRNLAQGCSHSKTNTPLWIGYRNKARPEEMSQGPRSVLLAWRAPLTQRRLPPLLPGWQLQDKRRKGR